MSRHQISPAWQTQRGPLVRASGCAEGVPVAGAKVYGETRQNLWVNPSGTTGGITCTSNDDGSLTISGANTTGGDVYLYSDVIESIPYGKQVTFSASNYGVAGEWRFVLSGIGGATPASQATFTAAKESPRPGTVAVVVTPGTTVNATVRVMLNEGSEAQPWCPPGLSSVSELSVVSAGKNLAVGEKTASGGTNVRLAEGTGIHLPSGSYCLSCKVAGAALLQIGVFDMGWNLVARAYNSNVLAFDIETAGTVFFDFYRTPSLSADDVTEIQLELGSTATAYEPPAVSETPIDLSGHELRSLPDGTRDVLAVDGSGAVEVEQAVNSVTFDGSGDETGSIYEDQYGHFFHLALPGNIGGDDPGADTGAVLCDTLPVNKYDGGNSKTGIWFLREYRHVVYVKPPEELASFSDFRTWLSQHPTTVIYPVATPQTVPLDPIAPPSIPAADATLWAASDVPCELEATTWTASGAEQGRQQAALVKLAQQVRQQAETVAALTTQALEA